MLTLVLTDPSKVTSVGWEFKSKLRKKEVWAFESMTEEEEQTYFNIYSERSKESDVIIILPSEENQPTIPKFTKRLAKIADKVIVHHGDKAESKRDKGGKHGTEVP